MEKEYLQKLAEEALLTIQTSYVKVIFINFTTRKFKVVYVPQSEQDEDPEDRFATIDEYYQWFISNYNVNSEDIPKFIDFFVNAKKGSSIVYRRLLYSDKSLIPISIYMSMFLLPSKDYTDENKECILYVKDINDLYVSEATAVATRAKRYDGMTGLLNHAAFEQDITKAKGNVGIAFIDINGLKYTNDKHGHKAGDALIMRVTKLLTDHFPAYGIYRTGGDEFIVFANNVKLRVFLHTVIAFHKMLWNGHGDDFDNPLMSLGYSADIAEDIDEVVDDAEKQMYEDKHLFYEQFPEYDLRGGTENYKEKE